MTLTLRVRRVGGHVVGLRFFSSSRRSFLFEFLLPAYAYVLLLQKASQDFTKFTRNFNELIRFRATMWQNFAKIDTFLPRDKRDNSLNCLENSSSVKNVSGRCGKKLTRARLSFSFLYEFRVCGRLVRVRLQM